ncbi:molybdenum cofactor guanylyltransferase [Saliphagus sp. LR7]|uniref:molybdenum cofactor guanylyltransferase n=1 Tax=Saliphagus sp. LR7 TaxID=2282654 RepID=UPI0013005C71|nr:molybdenum cofactor guanylyltransferase [Saliphagus sp. LR7]
MRSAVVVAGGFSERFGDREKALARVAGEPMIARVVRAVAPEVGEVVVNCRPDQRGAFEAVLPPETRFALDRDDERDAGPVAGLARGLRVADGDRTIALACDLPLLETKVVARLFETHERSGCDATAPVLEEYPQPLAAVYDSRRARRACEAALRADERRLVAAVSGLETVRVPESDLREWADPDRLRAVDTPADLARVRRRLETRERGGPADVRPGPSGPGR